MKLIIALALFFVYYCDIVLSYSLFGWSLINHPEDDPDVGRRTPDVIRSRGFVCEEHFVTTNDGYILGVHRIVNPKLDPSHRKPRPVILHHGLGGSSVDFVINQPGGHVDEPIVRDWKTGEQIVGPNLGFELAKRGYDVWMPNVRGNSYSTNHTTLSPSSRQFWEFGLEEHSLSDLPTVINYVRRSTGSDKVSYVGHSQGTTMMFALLSEKPETYTKVVEPFIALAPVAHTAYVHVGMKFLALNLWLPRSVYWLKGGKLVPDWIIRPFLRYTCGSWITSSVCEKTLFFLAGGWDSPQLNQTRLAVYGGSESLGISMKNIYHWSQNVKSKSFRHFDHDSDDENIKRYGRPTPPEFPLEQISRFNYTKHIALFHSSNDNLADPKDVQILRNRLSGGPFLDDYHVPYEKWSHLDYIIGQDAGPLINDRVWKLLEKYQYNNGRHDDEVNNNHLGIN